MSSTWRRRDVPSGGPGAMGHHLPDRGQAAALCPCRDAGAFRGQRGVVGHHLPDRGQTATAKSVAIIVTVAPCPRRDARPVRCVGGDGASAAGSPPSSYDSSDQGAAGLCPVPTSRRRGVPLRRRRRPSPAGSRPGVTNIATCPRRDAGALRCAGSDGRHLPDRGQAVSPCARVATPGRSVGVAITCRIAARGCHHIPRDHVATPGRYPMGHRLPDRSQAATPDRRHVAPCPRRDAGAFHQWGFTCRIAANGECPTPSPHAHVATPGRSDPW
jgi:hypothetical protein